MRRTVALLALLLDLVLASGRPAGAITGNYRA
jgi:hypothetical protein